ncbi:type IV prepilin PilS [Escherichia coli]|uniref:Type IV prepilin PilS n=1 Tax=Escherichia coli TaxID=562 RepID=A0A376ZZQ7_ECOLX|nr:type IV prepilin PilS [Escherichia coli]
MLVENINTTLTGNNKKNEPHDKGWGILEQGTIALVVLFVIVVVLGSLYALRTRTNVATETANIQTIITSAQSLLKGSDGYTFTSSAKMTGALIQMGAVPSGMTVQGDKTSGTATLYKRMGRCCNCCPGFNIRVQQRFYRYL